MNLVHNKISKGPLIFFLSYVILLLKTKFQEINIKKPKFKCLQSKKLYTLLLTREAYPCNRTDLDINIITLAADYKTYKELLSLFRKMY